MTSTFEVVCANVLKKVTPSQEENERILNKAEDLKRKVAMVAEEAGVEAEVRVEGSVAKDTWLSGEPDIDIFMRVPITMPLEEFGTICLEIAKRAMEGFKQVERFAEHPYLESMIDDVRVNIVPCYRVNRGGWVSATDRTPFHTDYVKPLLDEKLRGEIRLLKKFMRGIDIYGAEIKIGGFSGYLCELLVLHYGSFAEVLRSIANWREDRIIDHEGYYEGREQEVRRIFEEPFVVVDPVDKGRNVASAVRRERLDEFIAASRAFLKRPSLGFFYPPEMEPLNAEELVHAIKARGSDLVFIRFGGVKAVPDVLWGQLYKSLRSSKKMLQQNDFNVIRDHVWSNEQDINVFIFEVQRRFLPPIKKHFGPPLEKKFECEKFLRKHLNAPYTISGPRIEGSRWVVETTRGYTDVVRLLVERLRDGGRSIGIAELVSKAIPGTLKIMMNEEVAELYSLNHEFAKFLTEFLKGSPRWLSE